MLIKQTPYPIAEKVPERLRFPQLSKCHINIFILSTKSVQKEPLKKCEVLITDTLYRKVLKNDERADGRKRDSCKTQRSSPRLPEIGQGALIDGSCVTKSLSYGCFLLVCFVSAHTHTHTHTHRVTTVMVPSLYLFVLSKPVL